MKRSAIINLIHEYLWNNYPDINASDILTIIEQVGMSPPPLDKHEYEGEDYWAVADEKFGVWEWEKEDMS